MKISTFDGKTNVKFFLLLLQISNDCAKIPDVQPCIRRSLHGHLFADDCGDGRALNGSLL